ncbi:dihydropyrimidinase [candidate division KSB3 bacterium]|uniref:Dihydropyrimidinase n=1 Tax=candidate division KSB3 bacterium TaxID=2044937 RepID=A0A9D5JS39_9BACT|nr:dihydropyrimidinase [candidate division KSB3 bacterium]MBD3323225.1 dihydropyrimidinase [candidate division KSB3 bacterium]
MDLIIRNGTVVTASEIMRADVGVNDGKIVAIADTLDDGATSIDAAGKYVFPAGVETHTHIDGVLHGMRTVDDWYYASMGAACGGTGTIVDFPMQGQTQTVQETVDEFKGRAEGKSILDFAFTPILSQHTEATYAEIPGLIDAGIPSFKVFMYYDWQISDYNLAKMLDTVGSHGGILAIHCENAGTIDYLGDKAISQGKVGPEWHAPNRPVSTEVEAASRVMYVAGEIGAPVLIVHISAAPVVEEIAKAKARGVLVYGETMPHFLCLDDSRYDQEGYEGMKAVITPPLRPKEHQQALWNGLKFGLLSTVGSDHCAFPYKDKIRLYETRGKIFPMVPHGAPGIETRIPLLFSEGVSKGRISLTRFAEVIATNPAKLFGLYPQKGTLAVGSDADILIIDPDKEVTIRQSMLHGKTDYTPYEDWPVKGYPVTTISRGTVVVQDGEVVVEPGHGKFLKRQKFQPF